MNNRFYVTTPIYYVNDKPHIGHAYTTVLADVLAGCHRLFGDEVFFLTGTDEHGQKVLEAAQARGVTPQQQADETVVRFQELWKKLAIRNDDFIRTTEPRHKVVVQKILQDLYDKGEIYRAEYDGWYCVPDERFFTDKDVAEGKCPLCGREVRRMREANYFFRMSRHQAWLVDYIESHPDFIRPDFRRNETLGFLRKPLQDLCISRPASRLPWGIPLPFDEGYVTYVWFDALVNYISAAGYLSDDAAFQRRWPAVHLIGKDILTTHTVYWPTMLHAIGLEMPKTVFAHGWWLSGAQKMGKSLGNAVNPMDMLARYGAEPFRYFLMGEMVMGQDAAFTLDAFVRRYNADLANDLGNLSRRLSGMIARYFAGKMPAAEPGAFESGETAALWGKAVAAVATLRESLEKLELSGGIAAVLDVVRETNRYIEARKPWVQAKEPDTAPLGTTLRAVAETLRVAAALLMPVMPGKMTALRAALAMENPGQVDLAKLTVPDGLATGAALPESPVLFPRIEAEKEEAPSPAPAAKPAAPAAKPAAAKKPEAKKADGEEGAGLITADEFRKVHLKTATVMAAEAVPGSEKLLKLNVLMGEERRQIVAGIALYYKPEEVVGKTVVVVENLEPAVIRGVKSQGMLLAASKGFRLRLVTVDGDLASGATVR